jgi:hypothetical protein
MPTTTPTNDIQVQLNDSQIRGLITAAVVRQHAVTTTVAVATHGERSRKVTSSDKPTPSAAKYKAQAALWQPVVTAVYASPAGAALKGVITDPRIGTTRILVPPPPTRP